MRERPIGNMKFRPPDTTRCDFLLMNNIDTFRSNTEIVPYQSNIHRSQFRKVYFNKIVVPL